MDNELPDRSARCAEMAISQLLLFLTILIVACRQPNTIPPTLAVLVNTPLSNSVATIVTNVAVTVTDPPATPTPVLPVGATPSLFSPLTFHSRTEFEVVGSILDLALIDLTGGGLPDIVASTQNQDVYVFTLDGTGTAFHAHYSDPIQVVAGGDMDGDTVGDVFLGSADQSLTVNEVDMNAGIIVPRNLQPIPVSGEITAITILPTNNGQILLVGTEGGKIMAFNASLQEEWIGETVNNAGITRFIPLPSAVPTPLLIAGYQNGQLIAWNNAGNKVWNTTMSDSITAIVQADLNDDNGPEVIAAAEGGTLMAVNTQGSELWRWSSNEPINTLFVIDDWDSDQPAIIIGSGLVTGRITVLGATGQPIWESVTSYAPQAVTSADVDEDGYLDLVIGDSRGNVLVIDRTGALRGSTNFPSPINRLNVVNSDNASPPEILAVAGPIIYLLEAAPAISEPPPLSMLPPATALPTIPPIVASDTSLPLNQLRPHYEMLVDLDYFYHTVYVTQTVTIPNTSRDNWATLVFHAAPAYWPGFLDLEKIDLITVGVSIPITPSIASTMIYLSLPAPLRPGETASVQLNYSLTLPRLDPLGWGPVGNAGWGADLVQMGDWYPSLVPYDAGNHQWQTWDYTPVGDPVRNGLADFSVQITTAPEVIIAAPGYLGTDGNTRRYRLENGRAFAFLASADYVIQEGYSQNTPVRVFTLSNHRSLAPIILNTAIQSINLFRDRFGLYPYDELIIAENGFLTAMEYSAIISLSGFAFNEYNDTVQSLLTPITAHEIAHQYWYGAVGNDQIFQPWLDEALCMFAELIYYETYYPDDVTWWWQYRVVRWNPTGYVDDTIYDYGSSPDFVHNVYSQAAYFLRDMRTLMGEDSFNNFLRAYYQRYRNQTANTDDFFALAQNYTNADLTSLIGRYFAKMPAVFSSPESYFSLSDRYAFNYWTNSTTSLSYR